jgi:hypothetical protein
MITNFLKKYKSEVTIGILVFLFFLFRDIIKSFM